jgi:hypothetical protein
MLRFPNVLVELTRVHIFANEEFPAKYVYSCICRTQSPLGRNRGLCTSYANEDPDSTYFPRTGFGICRGLEWRAAGGGQRRQVIGSKRARHTSHSGKEEGKE